MKKLVIAFLGVLISTSCFAQYNVGTSTAEKDIFGNPTGRVIHRDAYGNVTGSSTAEKDIFGNSTGRVVHRDAYGNSIGTSTQEKDIFGILPPQTEIR